MGPWYLCGRAIFVTIWRAYFQSEEKETSREEQTKSGPPRQCSPFNVANALTWSLESYPGPWKRESWSIRTRHLLPPQLRRPAASARCLSAAGGFSPPGWTACELDAGPISSLLPSFSTRLDYPGKRERERERIRREELWVASCPADTNRLTGALFQLASQPDTDRDWSRLHTALTQTGLGLGLVLNSPLSEETGYEVQQLWLPSCSWTIAADSHGLLGSSQTSGRICGWILYPPHGIHHYRRILKVAKHSLFLSRFSIIPRFHILFFFSLQDKKLWLGAYSNATLLVPAFLNESEREREFFSFLLFVEKSGGGLSLGSHFHILIRRIHLFWRKIYSKCSFSSSFFLTRIWKLFSGIRTFYFACPDTAW